MDTKYVAIFCSAKDDVSQDYFDLTCRIGDLLADKGYDLIFGGDKVGLMGCIGKKMRERSRYVIGVCIDKMYHSGKIFPDCNEYRLVSNLMDRKKEMLYLADTVLVLPGGIGTINELLDAVLMKHLGIINQRIIVLNYQSFYELFYEMLNGMIAKGFLSGGLDDYFVSVADDWQLAEIL